MNIFSTPDHNKMVCKIDVQNLKKELGRVVMRLWHQNLLPLLPRQQLLGQHRECCALRGKAWGKPHSVVNYVFHYSKERLWAYHMRVMEEMLRRGFRPDRCWFDPGWRGKLVSRFEPDLNELRLLDGIKEGALVYPEHNQEYLNECLANLRGKGIVIN